MTANLIDLRWPHQRSSDDLLALHAYLAQFVGEPFRFARVSYGDELTLHFGDLRPAKSTKLKQKLYGAYILGVRGSPWVLKPGAEPVVVTAGVLVGGVPASLGWPLPKEELENLQFMRSESRVLAAIPFEVQPVNGLGLQVRMSDGSALLIVPSLAEPEEPEDEKLPELADWELLTPRGLLSAGPGLKWSFKPSSEFSESQPS